MSLRLDLESAIKNLRITLENLDSDLQRFEGLIENHFSLSLDTEQPKKLPAQVFHNLEKEIKEAKEPKVLTK